MPDETPAFTWCVVANVTRDPHPEGPDGALRLGTKNFAPGAKLYCFPILWGDGGERIRVLGRHRGGAKLVDMVVESRRLVDWRAVQAFQPHVVRELGGFWGATEEARERAIATVEAFRSRGEVA